MPRACWGEVVIATERLTLREWRDDDAAAMHRIGRDPRVMEFLGPLMEGDDARTLVAGQIVNQSLFGHCFWAVERLADGAVLGFCGVNPRPVGDPFAGVTEIGWRLAFDAWGKGYAREAATAVLDWAWRNLDGDRVISMTVPANTRSWGLMERLGMRRVHDGDFDDSDLAEDDPLRRHILYRIDRPASLTLEEARRTAA